MSGTAANKELYDIYERVEPCDTVSTLFLYAFSKIMSITVANTHSQRCNTTETLIRRIHYVNRN